MIDNFVSGNINKKDEERTIEAYVVDSLLKASKDNLKRENNFVMCIQLKLNAANECESILPNANSHSKCSLNCI